MKTTAIKLKPAAEKAVKQGHPWVFEGGIAKLSGDPQTGWVTIMFDRKDNKLLAVGLYDADSPIRIKVLDRGSLKISRDWFEKKLSAARKLREPLLLSDTNSYRLVNGENDGLPSLIADVYGSVLVLKLYSGIWFPYMEPLLEALKQVGGVTSLVLRLGRSVAALAPKGYRDGQVLCGAYLEGSNIVFREHGLKFMANPSRGHKTGYFLDHRHNRKRVGELAKNRSVLDVFSYAGGFSVHAMAGAALEVTSVDISQQAMQLAKKNMALNDLQGAHKVKVGDAFELLWEMLRQGTSFDLVIIDPPSFAKAQAEVPGALNSYRRLAKLGAKLVASDGILVLASCSSRVSAEQFFATCQEALDETGIRYRLKEKTYHDVDHPISFAEGAYLKCGYYFRS